MTSRIFNRILETRIQTFLSSFVDDAESLFYDRERLIHPGEYGVYRERLLRSLLSSVIPGKYQISDGFIISGTDHVSTQCDVVIYDPDAAPILREDTTRFFPIESVIAVGEVKSTLGKAQFTDAVRKLASVKKIADDLDGRYDAENRVINVRKSEHDQIFTFIVCKKFDFDVLAIKPKALYDDFLHHHRANLLLSVEDGIIAHKIVFDDLPTDVRDRIRARGVQEGATVLYEYPIFEKQELNNLSYSRVDTRNRFFHIKLLLSALFICCKRKRRVHFDLLEYYQGPSGIFS